VSDARDVNSSRMASMLDVAHSEAFVLYFMPSTPENARDILSFLEMSMCLCSKHIP
jgi:hypothetical protein